MMIYQGEAEKMERLVDRIKGHEKSELDCVSKLAPEFCFLFLYFRFLSSSGIAFVRSFLLLYPKRPSHHPFER